MTIEVKHTRHRWLGHVEWNRKVFPRRPQDGILKAKGNKEGQKRPLEKYFEGDLKRWN